MSLIFQMKVPRFLIQEEGTNVLAGVRPVWKANPQGK